MESDRTAEELFIRSQDLLMPDEMNGELGSQYTPGSATSELDSGIANTRRMRAPMPLTRDFEGNLFLRMQDLIEPDELEHESNLYRPGSALRSSCAVATRLRRRVASTRRRGLERLVALRSSMTGRIHSVRHGVNRNLRKHPAKWASIATGTGMGVGLMSRMLRARRRRQMMPRLILIETC